MGLCWQNKAITELLYFGKLFVKKDLTGKLLCFAIPRQNQGVENERSSLHFSYTPVPFFSELKNAKISKSTKMSFLCFAISRQCTEREVTIKVFLASAKSSQ